MQKDVTIKVKTGGHPAAESLKYKLASDQMINLTRPRAFEILECATFSAERPVREDHVQHLFNEWLAGRFLWHQAVIALGVINEMGANGERFPKCYRLNGQHTCWMRVNIPKEKEPAVAKVRQLVYEVSDMDGLRELYSVIDRNAPRTNAHITNVLLADASDGCGIPMSYVSLLTAGFKTWSWEHHWDRKIQGTPQEVAALLQGKHRDLFRTVGQYFQQRYSDWKPVRRSAIVAAMFATFDKCPSAAPDFWGMVCSGLNFTSTNDPRYQLRVFCEEHPQSNRSSVNISSEELYRVAINLWNKWRKGDEVAVVRSTETRVKPV